MTYYPNIPKDPKVDGYGQSIANAFKDIYERHYKLAGQQQQVAASTPDANDDIGDRVRSGELIEQALGRLASPQLPYVPSLASDPSAGDPQSQTGSMQFNTAEQVLKGASSGVWSSKAFPPVQSQLGAYWLLPYGIDTNTTTDDVLGANNQVRAHRLYIPVRLLVARISANLSNGFGGGTGDVGLYTSDGVTKIISFGGISVAVISVKSATPTPIYIGPGWYWLAWTFDNTTATWKAINNGSAVDNVLNDGTVQKGTAANAAAAGVLPTTLGAITGATNFGTVVFKLQT